MQGDSKEVRHAVYFRSGDEHPPQRNLGKDQRRRISHYFKWQTHALLSAVSEETLEKTLRRIRRSRALMALEEMQKKSLASGLDKISNVEIEARIRVIRKTRRK
jgi:hypothetical protein